MGSCHARHPGPAPRSGGHSAQHEAERILSAELLCRTLLSPCRTRSLPATRLELTVSFLVGTTRTPRAHGRTPSIGSVTRSPAFPRRRLGSCSGRTQFDCYGFDRNEMIQIAARVGPRASDVLGYHSVDRALVEHFDLRSGYSKPPVVVDPDPLTWPSIRISQVLLRRRAERLAENS